MSLWSDTGGEDRNRYQPSTCRLRVAIHPLARARQLLENGFSGGIPKEIAEKHNRLIEQPVKAMDAIADYDAAVNAYLEASRVSLGKTEK